jgi:alpha(1,3/1,4) fucosyltransferase
MGLGGLPASDVDMMSVKRQVFIDPPYTAYYRDRLFDVTDRVLNRDGSLEAFTRLRSAFDTQGIALHTADYLLEGTTESGINDYYSLGLLDNYPKLAGREDVRLCGFYIMEPPAVAPHLYRALPKLTRYFEQVYVHNTVGDGYSLKGVDQSKLRKFYWPQPYSGVLDSWHRTDRMSRIVVINGNHIPRSFRGELYSKRIKAMAALAKIGVVDLYGRGWNQWWSHRSMWPPYWRNYRRLMSIYRGPCDSKYEVLGRYRFSLCFENMTMTGYLTEKLFDCLYAGTVPLYLGAPDISSLVPAGAFIDCRRFDSWEEMWREIANIPDERIQAMRLAGREFIEGDAGLKYYNSLIDIFCA